MAKRSGDSDVDKGRRVSVKQRRPIGRPVSAKASLSGDEGHLKLTEVKNKNNVHCR